MPVKKTSPKRRSRRPTFPQSAAARPAKSTATAPASRDHAFLQALLNSVPDCIYFKDLESRFMCVSAAMAKKFGVASPDDLVGKTDFDFFSSEHALPAFNDEQRIIRTREPVVDIEEKEPFEDGRVAWASTSKMPLYDDNGAIIGTFGISRDITSRKEAERRLAVTQKELIEASRLAGMAEIASGVLHNIGNGLNSVNTSVALVAEQVKRSRVGNLAKAAQMIEEHRDDLAAFLTTDKRGSQLPNYIIQLAGLLATERENLQQEVGQLRHYIEHIKQVVAMQQNYARVSGIVEDVPAEELINEALQISELSLNRHGVEVNRNIVPVPPVRVTRHKVLQILVNFIRNAKYALDESGRTDRKNLTIELRSTAEGTVRITVRDNGVGIAPENLARIFNFGFTTRQDGHGFGLHSSANAAKEIGGKIHVDSDGLGTGAAFTLELPAALDELPPAA